MIYQLDNGQIMLEFGHGDILVPTLCRDNDDFVYVGFTQAINNYQIGENVIDKSESSIPNVVMAFDKVESIDVVIKNLQSAKDYLASKDKEENGGD